MVTREDEQYWKRNTKDKLIIVSKNNKTIFKIITEKINVNSKNIKKEYFSFILIDDTNGEPICSSGDLNFLKKQMDKN